MHRSLMLAAAAVAATLGLAACGFKIDQDETDPAQVAKEWLKDYGLS